jgi:hypothetical protein
MEHTVISPTVKFGQTIHTVDCVVICVSYHNQLLWCASQIIRIKNNILSILENYVAAIGRHIIILRL